MTEDSENAGNYQTPNTERHKEDFVPPDGGWGWVVCFTSLMANGTVLSILNTFGILYVYLLKEYAKDDLSYSFKTSWIGSTCISVTYLMSIFASMCKDRFGFRPTAFLGAFLGVVGLFSSAFIQQLELLYLSFGLILGVGLGFTYFTSLVILGHYFKKHMGIVNGIVSMGSSIYTVSLSLVLPTALESLGIKFTFIILCGLYSMLLLCTLTWKPLLYRKYDNTEMVVSNETYLDKKCSCSTKYYLNWKVFGNRTYFVWFLGFIVAFFGYIVPFVHLVKHTQDTFPGSNAFILITCLYVTSGFGKIVFGKIADLKCVNRIYMQQCAFVLMGVLEACIPFSEKFEGLIVICLIFGVCDGIVVCLIGPIAFDIMGPIDASQAIGFLLGGFSIPFAVGPPIAGFLYDHLHTYEIAFVVAGVTPIVGAIIMCLIPRVQPNIPRPARTETHTFSSIATLNVDHAGQSTLDTQENEIEIVCACHIKLPNSTDKEYTTHF